MINNSIFYLILIGLTHGAVPHGVMVINAPTEVKDLATDLTNWMTLLPADLQKVPINYLAIPGSHDSFTVDISKDSNVSPDGVDILKKLEFLTVVKDVMANWSKTQAFNVVQQLEAGIRFFDLRLCFDSDDGHFHFCHSLYSTEVYGVLRNISSYLDAHPQEVVILDCQHFYNFTTETHAEIIQALKDIFGSKLVPYQSSMDSITLENLAKAKQQVLVIYRDMMQSSQDFLWSTNSFPTPWYDTMDSEQLISNLNNGLADRPSDTAYVSQLILTPPIEYILAHLLSTLKQKCALDFEDARTQWISAQKPGQYGVNIVLGDFIDLSDDLFSRSVINLNSKLDTKELNKGFFKKVVTFVKNLETKIFS
ncbi:hypothetical protein ABEB36_008788 [Hypothenemus hampei]|uniref:Phosphatidylinositol-specific phospholipase C X domain-containing protein n=1 Tax=Hypothenemus hampei TaxID=57062 RepID=A0ABD1EN39_HYPHA